MCATISCLRTAAQYVLLFLVLPVNSDWFQILRSYTFLHVCTLAACSYVLLFILMSTVDVAYIYTVVKYLTYSDLICVYKIGKNVILIT